MLNVSKVNTISQISKNIYENQFYRVESVQSTSSNTSANITVISNYDLPIQGEEELNYIYKDSDGNNEDFGTSGYTYRGSLILPLKKNGTTLTGNHDSSGTFVESAQSVGDGGQEGPLYVIKSSEKFALGYNFWPPSSNVRGVVNPGSRVLSRSTTFSVQVDRA